MTNDIRQKSIRQNAEAFISFLERKIREQMGHVYKEMDSDGIIQTAILGGYKDIAGSVVYEKLREAVRRPTIHPDSRPSRVEIADFLEDQYVHNEILELVIEELRK